MQKRRVHGPSVGAALRLRFCLRVAGVLLLLLPAAFARDDVGATSLFPSSCADASVLTTFPPALSSASGLKISHPPQTFLSLVRHRRTVGSAVTP